MSDEADGASDGEWDAGFGGGKDGPLVAPKYREEQLREYADVEQFSRALQQHREDLGALPEECRVVVLGRHEEGERWYEIATYWEGDVKFNAAGTRLDVPWPSRQELVAIGKTHGQGVRYVRAVVRVEI